MNVVKSETEKNVDIILMKTSWADSEDGNFFKKSKKMCNSGSIVGQFKKEPPPPIYCPIFVNNRQTVTKLLGHDNGLLETKEIKKKFKKCIMVAMGEPQTPFFVNLYFSNNIKTVKDRATKLIEIK